MADSNVTITIDTTAITEIVRAEVEPIASELIKKTERIDQLEDELETITGWLSVLRDALKHEGLTKHVGVKIMNQGLVCELADALEVDRQQLLDAIEDDNRDVLDTVFPIDLTSPGNMC